MKIGFGSRYDPTDPDLLREPRQPDSTRTSPMRFDIAVRRQRLRDLLQMRERQSKIFRDLTDRRQRGTPESRVDQHA